MRRTGPSASMNCPVTKAWTANAASGTVIRTRQPAARRSRGRVSTTFASSQKMVSVLKYMSRRNARLPPGQYERGSVASAQITRAVATTISGVTRVIDPPPANRSNR